MELSKEEQELEDKFMAYSDSHPADINDLGTRRKNAHRNAKQCVAIAKEYADHQAKKKAIAFARWMDYNDYECVLHTDDNEKIWESIKTNRKTYTTEQLYESESFKQYWQEQQNK